MHTSYYCGEALVEYCNVGYEDAYVSKDGYDIWVSPCEEPGYYDVGIALPGEDSVTDYCGLPKDATKLLIADPQQWMLYLAWAFD